MAFRFDGDSIEVWVIPVAVLTGVPTSVGGERGYIYAPDGRSVVRTVDHIAEYRAAPVADSGTVNIISTEPGVPTLSEFYLANQLNALGRSVAIVMPGLTSTLVTQNGATAWVQVGHR